MVTAAFLFLLSIKVSGFPSQSHRHGLEPFKVGIKACADEYHQPNFSIPEGPFRARYLPLALNPDRVVFLFLPRRSSSLTSLPFRTFPSGERIHVSAVRGVMRRRGG